MNRPVQRARASPFMKSRWRLVIFLCRGQLGRGLCFQAESPALPVVDQPTVVASDDKSARPTAQCFF